MQLLGRLLVLAACVLAIYAVPHIKPSSFSAFSVISDLNKAQKACWQTYHERQNEINLAITVQTAACLSASNQTSNSSNAEITAQVDIIRTNLTNLQDNVSNCLAITDNLNFVQCVERYNNVNMDLLASANLRSQEVEAKIQSTQVTKGGSTTACIAMVAADGTRNYTIADEEYTECRRNIYYPVIIN